VTAIEMEADPPHITLARNEHYWGGQAKLDGIEYVVMDFDDALEAYKRGELDITIPDFDTYPALEADPVLSRELLELRSPLVGLFHFNMTREPFQDKLVRQAFAYAFDREAYCQDIHRGTCTPQASWMLPGVTGAIESDVNTYDPQKAREALAASTYGGPENLPEIVYYHIVWGDADSDEWGRQHAEWVADQFRQVLGVELTLSPVTIDELIEMENDAATRPQINDSSWWSDPSDPHGWMIYWTCGHEDFAEDVGYCNPAYDALVERADSELDPTDRIRLAEESQRVMMADVPAIFGYTWEDVILIKPYVTGYSATAPNQAWPGWWTPLEVDIAPH
jgi:oligopeptide transport system substrate-binding protein